MKIKTHNTEANVKIEILGGQLVVVIDWPTAALASERELRAINLGSGWVNIKDYSPVPKGSAFGKILKQVDKGLRVKMQYTTYTI